VLSFIGKVSHDPATRLLPASPTDTTHAVEKEGFSPEGILYVTKTATPVADQTITLDRRTADRRDDVAAENPSGRRKQQRRRQIDPTTCERDYSDQEIQFMHAMDEYKRAAGRMFPTCSEVLEVIRSLGYVQLDQEQRDLLQLDEESLVEAYSGEQDEPFDNEDDDNKL